jgi:hypothetical protein
MPASLLGTFTAAEGAGALTTGTRTTVSGSLITAQGAVWATTSGPTVPTPTDSKSNAYTDDVEIGNGAGSSWLDIQISHNIGGTRGASHSVSLADTNVQSLTACEWSGVASSPTIATGTNTGTSTTPSGSVSPASASLVVGAMAPDYGLSATMSVTNGTEAIEADENNTHQAHGVAYKTAASGATTIAWSHTGPSSPWAVVLASFTEAAGGGFRSRIAGGFVVTE